MAATEQVLRQLIVPAVEALGFELWGLEYQSQNRQALLRVYIDGPDGVTVDDCAAVSRQISAVLDVEDPIAGEYTLEVGSPGMDRPLYTLEQFRQYLGESVKLRLRSAFEGRRNFNGELRAVEGDEIVLLVGDHEYVLPVEWIEKANLIPRF